jgi:hypothetical protein
MIVLTKRERDNESRRKGREEEQWCQESNRATIIQGTNSKKAKKQQTTEADIQRLHMHKEGEQGGGNAGTCSTERHRQETEK